MFDSSRSSALSKFLPFRLLPSCRKGSLFWDVFQNMQSKRFHYTQHVEGLVFVIFLFQFVKYRIPVTSTQCLNIGQNLCIKWFCLPPIGTLLLILQFHFPCNRFADTAPIACVVDYAQRNGHAAQFPSQQCASSEKRTRYSLRKH